MAVKTIGVCGFSGSGKTLYSREISKKFRKSYVLSMDRYYKTVPKEIDVSTYNFDEPSAIDFKKLEEDIFKLKNGEEASIPNYDFITHSRTDEIEKLCLDHDSILIIEGIFLLSVSNVRNLIDMIVYIDVDADTCFKRRLVRDMNERGRDKKEIVEQYLEYVKPSQEKYIKPLIKHASIIINNNNNNFIIDIPNKIINL